MFAIKKDMSSWRYIRNINDIRADEDYSESYPIVEKPVVPISVTPWQLRTALNILNLRASVENAVSSSSDQSIKDGWEYAQEFVENNYFVNAICNLLGKTEEEKHGLFLLAKSQTL